MPTTDMLREQEAIQQINQIRDPITNALVHHTHFVLLRRFAEKRNLPIADFDVRFFVDVLEEACGDHETIRRLLSGQRVGAWPDAED